MTDMTQRRVETKVKAMLAEIADVYERRAEPKPDFWPTWDKEELVLDGKLKRRPLALTEIEGAIGLFRARVLAAL